MVTASLEELELFGTYRARELWSGKELGAVQQLSACLPAHGAAVYRLRVE